MFLCVRVVSDVSFNLNKDIACRRFGLVGTYVSLCVEEGWERKQKGGKRDIDLKLFCHSLEALG